MGEVDTVDWNFERLKGGVLDGVGYGERAMQHGDDVDGGFVDEVDHRRKMKTP